MSIILLLVYLRFLSVKINSFYRSPEHNKNVGGVVTSKHQYLQAVDIPLSTKETIIDSIKKSGFKIIKETDKNHYHIETTEKSELLVTLPFLIVMFLLILFLFERKKN